jgi:lysophospholipase L1-like esterase
VTGTTISFYYTDPTSIFVYSGVFNFGQYLTDNSVTLSSGDWVLIHLGINDIIPVTSDAAMLTKIRTMTSQLNGMITSIKAAVSGIRIALCLTIAPDHQQDGFGAAYGSLYGRARYKRNRDLWVEHMIATYDLNKQANVYLVPFHCAVDTRNNFPQSTVVVNARNAATYSRSVGGVHPSDYGYWQMADALYCFLRGQET